jgi:hypothetical protein
MPILQAYQKNGSAVTAYWQAQTPDATTVGSVTAPNKAPQDDRAECEEVFAKDPAASPQVPAGSVRTGTALGVLVIQFQTRRRRKLQRRVASCPLRA